MAVYSFFILSGYLMTLIMHKTYSYSSQGFVSYLLNRFYRLFPVYWVLIAISILIFVIVGQQFLVSFHPVMKIPTTGLEWIANIVLIFPMFEPVNYPVRLSPAAWALTIELFFYLVIGLGASKTITRTVIWVCLSIAYLIYQGVVEKIIGFGYGNIFSASLPFSFGALIFFLKDKSYLANIKQSHTATLIALFGVNIIVAALQYQPFGIELWKSLVLFDAMNITLSCLIIIGLSRIRVDKFRKLDNQLGDLSYPMYIFHWSAACLTYWLLSPYMGNTTVLFVTSVCLTISVSVMVNKYIGERVDLLRETIKKQLAV